MAIDKSQWAFLDNLNEGVAFLSRDGDFIYSNGAAKNLLDVTESVAHLKDVYQLHSSHDTWEAWQKMLQPPHESYLKTSLGYLFVQSAPLLLAGVDGVQLTLNSSPHTDVLPDSKSPEKLYAYIEQLRRENRRLSHRSQQVEYLTVLSEASSKFAHSSSEHEILVGLGESMLRLVNGFGYSIYLWDQDLESVSLELDYVHLPEPQLKLDSGQHLLSDNRIFKQFLDENTLLILESGRSLPGVPVWSQPNVPHCVVVLALFVAEKPYGVIALGLSGSQNEIDEHIVQFLATQVNQASIALEKNILFRELDQRVATRTQDLGAERDRFQTLLRINNELASTLDEDRVLVRALELVNEVVKASQGAIILIDGTTNDLVYRGVIGDDLVGLQGQVTGLNKSDGIIGWMVENQESVLAADLDKEARWPERPLFIQSRSLVGAPLLFNQEVIGAMVLTHEEPDQFTHEQLRLIEGAAAQFSTALYNAHLYQLVSSQAGRLSGMLRDEQVDAAKNHAMLESIADGVLVSDESGRIIVANDALAEVLDLPKHKLLNRDVSELSGLYGMSDGVWHETIQTWAVEDSPTTREVLEETMSLDDDSKIVRVHLAPVFVDKRFFGTVSIFRDITKDVEVDRVKTEFVSTVSHELRTPLTSIKGYTDLLLMGAAGPLADGITRYLGVIKSNSDRLQELVNDLLDISRIETGKTELDLRPINVEPIIESVVNGHLVGRVKHEEKEMQTSIVLDKGLPLVNADAKRVTQIVTNLVDNAFNYTPENGRITVSAKKQDGSLLISIEDTGIGINDEMKEKIFERFVRSDDHRVQRVSGTGLGLAIVKSLVEMHGGELRVDSEVGVGSKFTFDLPLVTEEEQLI